MRFNLLSKFLLFFQLVFSVDRIEEFFFPLLADYVADLLLLEFNFLFYTDHVVEHF